MKTGAELILQERNRQRLQEGYNSEHDDEHASRELASAALGYLSHYTARAWVFSNELGMPGVVNGLDDYRGEPPPDSWPWEDQWWKPSSPERDLVKAGALIAAELDRLQRAKSK
jgi:hypothetical protein